MLIPPFVTNSQEFALLTKGQAARVLLRPTLLFGTKYQKIVTVSEVSPSKERG
jgi:hypothetical protein